MIGRFEDCAGCWAWSYCGNPACSCARRSCGTYGTGHVGVHGWIFLLLASVEIVAAALFLAPGARVTGGYLLLAVFLFAAAFHILHGEFNDVGWLAVYSAAVVVCLTH